MSGAATPTTSTMVNGNITTITINNPDGPTDTIMLNAANLETNPAQYITFSRATATAAPPKITFPANPNLSVAAGSTVNYTGISATDPSTGSTLTPTYSIPSGSILPVGVTTVTVSATNSAGLESSQTFTVTVAPAAPQVTVESIYNVDVSGKDNGITLGWLPVTGATSFNIYRMTSISGAYTLIQQHLAPVVPNSNSISELTVFNDANLTGINYFYRVTGVLTDSSGIDHEGPPSNVVSLAQAAPGGLTLQGVANSNVSNPLGGIGFSTLSTNPTTLLLSQSNVINELSGYPQYYDDGFAYLGKNWKGDGTFTVRLTSIYGNYGTTTNPNQTNAPYYVASFGLIFRDTATTTQPGFQADAGVCYQSYQGGQVTSFNRPLLPYGPGQKSLITASIGHPVPLWLRLQRVGSNFSSSYSTDGQTWSSGVFSTVAMSATTQIGLAVAAGGATEQDNGVFDNLVFLSPPTVATGNGSVALDWSQSTGAVSYTLARGPSPTGPFTNLPGATATTAIKFTDAGLNNLSTYYYQLSAVDASGVVTTVAPVSGIPALLSTPIVTATPGDGSITLDWGAITGATSYQIYQSSSATAGPYSKFTTTENSHTFSSLTNGTPCFFFVVASGSGNSADSTIVGAVPVKWIDLDLGKIGSPGSYTALKGVLSVSGGGADIGGSTDAFNYLYRTWSGDGTFIAHLARVTTDNTNASKSVKAGLMFRTAPATATATSTPNVFALDSLTGTSLQNRPTPNTNTSSAGGPSAIPPNWLRLERSGSTFTAYTSEDEINWLQISSNSVTNTIADPGLIGLAVNAQNNSYLATALFDASAFLVTPQSLMSSAVQGTNLNLGWTINPSGNVTDATVLQVEISPTGANTWTVLASNLPVSQKSYVVTGLSPSTTYDFRIKEMGGIISGDYGLLSGVKTKVGDLPASPINLTGLVQAGTSVKLSWTNQATTATNNAVAFRPTGTTSWTSYASNLSPTTTSEIVQGLVEGKSYDFEVYATNLAGASLSPPMVTVILPAAGSYGLWAASYGLTGNNASANAVPAGDGVSNALKYLIGVNPTVPITSAARNSLPSLGTATQNGKNYLTLTYRRSTADATGVTAYLQTSADLKTWTIVSPPDYQKTVGTDPGTNDPIVQVGAVISTTRQFVRLELVTP